MQTITWPQLVVLMAYGDGTEDSIAGELRYRNVNPVPEAEVEPGLIVDDPRLGRIRVEEGSGRVCRRGSLVRREHAGRPIAIVGEHTTWIWLDGNELPTAFPRATTAWGFGDLSIVERASASRWEGTDFTKLTGPIEAVEFLGRHAWAFELAPPSHKPYPVQMIVDADTGLVLRQANADFGSFTEWTSLDVDADLPDSLFEWDDPALPPVDHRAEHEAMMAERRAWLADRGIAGLTFTVTPELMLHEWDDDSGSFHLSFDSMALGSLLRRPRDDQPWADAEQFRWEHHYRWSDARWDWALGSRQQVNESQLAALREQLAQST